MTKRLCPSGPPNGMGNGNAESTVRRGATSESVSRIQFMQFATATRSMQVAEASCIETPVDTSTSAAGGTSFMIPNVGNVDSGDETALIRRPKLALGFVSRRNAVSTSATYAITVTLLPAPVGNTNVVLS